MNPKSAVQVNQSSIETDLSRYKQAADLAYRYAKGQAEDQKEKETSPFDEEDEKKPTKDKDTF